MPQLIQVDGIGNVEFADGISPAEIQKQVGLLYDKQESAAITKQGATSAWKQFFPAMFDQTPEEQDQAATVKQAWAAAKANGVSVQDMAQNAQNISDKWDAIISQARESRPENVPMFEAQRDAEMRAAGAEPMHMDNPVTLPKMKNEDVHALFPGLGPRAVNAIRAGQNVTAGTAEGFATPEGVAMFAPGIGAAIGKAFVGQMALSVPDQLSQAAGFYAGGDNQAGDEALMNAGSTAAMLGMPLLAGKGDVPPVDAAQTTSVPAPNAASTPANLPPPPVAPAPAPAAAYTGEAPPAPIIAPGPIAPPVESPQPAETPETVPATITGSNGGQAPEMPADTGAIPVPEQSGPPAPQLSPADQERAQARADRAAEQQRQAQTRGPLSPPRAPLRAGGEPLPPKPPMTDEPDDVADPTAPIGAVPVPPGQPDDKTAADLIAQTQADAQRQHEEHLAELNKPVADISAPIGSATFDTERGPIVFDPKQVSPEAVSTAVDTGTVSDLVDSGAVSADHRTPPRYAVQAEANGANTVIDTHTGDAVDATLPGGHQRAVDIADKLNQSEKETPYEPRQPQSNSPRMDVREPAGAGSATPPERPTADASGQQDATGVAPDDEAQGRSGDERGRGVRGGDAERAGTSGRAGDERQPAGASAVSGAAADLQKAGQPAVTPAPVADATPNHILPANEDWIPQGDKAKVRANLDAIALLKKLEAEQRPATPAEKAVLAKYTGWGGLKQIFDEGKAAYRKDKPWNDTQQKEYDNWEKQWGKLYDETKAALTPAEHAAAAKSMLNAHYTAREVINAVWKGAQRLGFKGGRALEPGAGIGHFIGLTPEAIRAQTHWSAVELDSISGRILTKLYPQARVQNVGFEKSRLAPNSQDLVISNVPFAKDGPLDKRYPNFSLHNYFFARALDVAKPGGIVAAITSDSTMDSPASYAARKYFADKADLVGAIRLPNTAFKKNAGTEVTTDILFFRKRDGTQFPGQPFKEMVPGETYKGQPLDLNEYYAAHPDMMLGRMSLEGSQYGPDQRALLPTPGADLGQQLDEAIAKLPENVAGTVMSAPADLEPAADVASGKLGRLQIKSGVPVLPQADGSVVKPDWAEDGKKVKQATAYVDVRDAAQRAINLQLDPNATASDLAVARKVLNAHYDAYTKKYGALNARKSKFLNDDVDFPLALALEDENTKLVLVGGKAKRETSYTKSKMFSERTLFPRQAPAHVDTVNDALQVSQNFQGKVDPDYMAKLTGKPVAAVKAELESTGQAFENPTTELWENRPTYLSGFVKDKLAAARNAAESDPRYLKHVAELEKVQPPPIPIENIGVKLGSVFVPESVIEKFLREKLGVEARVNFTPETGQWSIFPSAGQYSERNKTTYGIHDWRGDELVGESLNLKSATVFDPPASKDEGPRRNPTKSLQAQQKQDALQKAFKDFVRSSPEVSRQLEQIYNDKYNGVVAPKFEAPTWAHYPGASADIQLREHQKAVVTRMLQNSTLLAHAVGTGKSYAMQTAAMEMRRLGLAKKPMIVVQNATLEQFARSFKRLYPTARLLVPSSRERTAELRNKTMARIATGDWDAVIIPQPFINLLPDDTTRESGYINERLSELRSAQIASAREEGKKSPKAADLQRAIDKLQTRLDGLADRKKDNNLTFEQLGVDALFVDEAHAYKKLEFSTKMDNIKGLDKGASQRGWSMNMKTRFIQEKNQGRNVIFATGTPVSNTLAEAWNMMRYVRPDVLKAYGIEKFDDFASTFGDTVTQLEMTEDGGWKPVTRFARFVNGPELISAWRTVADVVTPEEINLPGLPSLKGGKPQSVNVPQTPAIKNYVKFLRAKLDEFAAMSGKDKRDNSHIPMVVQGLARKAMTDIRMIDPAHADEPGSKLNVAVQKIAEIYRDSTSVKGTQMVFADLFRDNPKNEKFNLFTELKRKLVEAGIPEKEILVVTDKLKDTARDAAFTKLNDGDTRIAIGTTDKMGVGVNAQEHMIALHHLAPPHRPMDIEQRNGRLVRQGNQNPEVQIFNYGVENSLDAAMYQKLATKQKFINQILRGDLQGRNFEDAANETSMSFEEQMAAFSGDKRAMEKVGLENQVRQLEAMRSGHFEQVRKARDTIQQLNERTIPYQQKQVAESTRQAATFAEAFAPDKEYVLQAGDKTRTGRKDVAESFDRMFKAAMALAPKYFREEVGFNMHAVENVGMDAGQVKLNGQLIKLRVLGRLAMSGVLNPDGMKVRWEFENGVGGECTTGVGFYHSLAASLERIAGLPEQNARSLANEQRNLRELTSFVQTPFDQEATLNDARAKLGTLTATLEAEGKASANPSQTNTPPSDADGPDDGQTEHDMSAFSDAVVRAPTIDGIKQVEHGFSGNTTLVQAAVQDVARVRNLVAPQTAGDAARFAGNLLRELNAKMANEMARADKGLKAFRRDFDRTPVNLKKFQYDPTLPLPRNFEFINAYESGNTSRLAPGDALAAAEFHRLNDADVARVHALGTGALTTFYKNYFPHIWDNPKQAEQVFGKILGHSPLEGPKAFLKQRTHQFFEEGLAAGLKPVHDNPVDLWLLKKREVERYILAHNFTTDMRAVGLMKFKYAFGQAPAGWATVNDKAFSVYGPPTVTIKEAFDAGMRSATLDLLKQLGVPHTRLARIGGQRWGYDRETPGVPGSESIVTKFAGPDEVIWHELGHVLHNRYKDLEPTLTATETQQAELRALADARLGANASASAKRNVRSMPEKMAVALQAYVHAPELMQKIAPTVKTAMASFIKAHPELAPINDIRPTLRVGMGETEMSHGGLLKLGDWVMPEEAANLVRNFLSPGLNPQLWYRTLRTTSNLLNGVQLGLSGFHLGFTSLDAASSRLAVALEDAASGKLGKALGTAASVPLAPLTNIVKGAKLRAEVLAPGTHPELAALAKALEQAGGRVGQDAFWQTEFTRRMTRAWHAGGLQYGKALGLAPFAAWEQTMRPILEYVVPRQKLGVFADMAQREMLKLGPNALADESREALRKAWDSVDNRMGQMVYDNLFYNRAVKDVSLLAFRAYGWQLGKYREGIGAVTDAARAAGKVAHGERPDFTHRMAYAMALPLMVGTAGGMIHYLMTGQAPQSAQDWFQPQTGEQDKNGNPVRLNLPSYVKDALAYGKHPLTSFGHSLNPLLSAMFDLFENKDFYNVRIRNPDDPLWKQGSDVAQFAAKQFVPFSVSGGAQLRAADAPAWKQLAPYFGITPVPQRLTLTPAQEMSAEITSAAMPQSPITPEQSDRSKLIRDVVKQIKAGNHPAAAEMLRGGLQANILNEAAVPTILDRLKYNPLQFQVHHMTPDAAMRVWRLANAPERTQLRPIIGAKVTNSKTLTPAQAEGYLKELK